MRFMRYKKANPAYRYRASRFAIQQVKIIISHNSQFVKMKKGGDKVNYALARKRIGATQKDIADKLGVNQATVCLWEKGITSPNVRLLPKVAELYHVTVDELLAPCKDRENGSR